MTATHPTTPSPLPTSAHAHDDFAAAVVQDLTRPVREQSTWGPLRTFLWAVPTLGFVPALAWPLHFSRFAAAEREQLARFARWMRRQSVRPEAAGLTDAASQLRPGPNPAALPVLLCTIAALALLLGGAGVLRATYLAPVGRPERFASAGHVAACVAWSVGLALAYLCHYLLVHRHVKGVRRFAESFNRFAEAEGLRPVDLPRGDAALSFKWLVGPIALGAGRAAWGFPMALAGAAQRHYMLATDPALRAALAERVTDMIVLRQPASPAARRVFGRCGHGRCRAPLARDARFCPRCGRITGGSFTTPRPAR